MSTFYGRKRQLKALADLMSQGSAHCVVFRGRRRIGKSRLAFEFSRQFKNHYFFSGLAPGEKLNATLQRQEFVRKMHEQKLSCIASQDWGDLFFQLAKHCKTGQVLIVLDEITWMCADDEGFLAKLKDAWDQHFSKNHRLFLIISGSNSAWIKNNILASTGFYGRISYRLKLEELPLIHCNEFWGAQKNNVAAYEKLKILAITGGIPRYLEAINPKQTAEQNLLRLCYDQGGLLFNEFDDLFHDLFDKKDKFYKQIISTLVDGKTNLDSIAESLQRAKGGDISNAIEELCQDGLLEKFYSWNIKTAETANKIIQYRLTDNYSRFYIKYILPYKARIERDDMQSLPTAWQSIIALQFEHLVIKNKKRLHKLIGVPAHEIVYANPYLQRQGKKQDGCQIDYMIQTKFNVLYVCEIKFSKNPLGLSVATEVENKIKKLVIPKGYSTRPILIQVNGVTDELSEKEYFATIVDFADFLNP